MKRWHWALIAAVTLLLALAAARQLFAVQIAEAAFKRAVADNVGRDPSAALPDGLHIYICGSGSPARSRPRGPLPRRTGGRARLPV
ncbi:hypothetical protein [Hyphomonas sp.]|uniref:hypothetical protein n=1 Tax=Hyphomonas sp. TaxID=87 RepID=UPI002614BE6B|nr:hypothetical protein [Hyphomonas sp.]